MDEKGAYRGWDLWQNDQSLSVHMIQSWPGNAIKVSTRRNVLEPSKWQHVFVTYNGSGKPGGIKIYVDGKEEKLKVDTNTLKPDATIRTETPLRVGQRSHSQVFDGGSVQDVRVYDRDLVLRKSGLSLKSFRYRFFLQKERNSGHLSNKTRCTIITWLLSMRSFPFCRKRSLI